MVLQSIGPGLGKHIAKGGHGPVQVVEAVHLIESEANEQAILGHISVPLRPAGAVVWKKAVSVIDTRMPTRQKRQPAPGAGE